MELIPILSAIILVATISTFLLAIGAYVLYKIRESKGQQARAPQPAAVKAELITPMEFPVQQEQPRNIHQPSYSNPDPDFQRQPLFVQQNKVPQRQTSPQNWQSTQPRQFSTNQLQRGYEGSNYSRTTERGSDKFYKYSSEGYINPKEDKQAGALKWR